MSIRLMSEAWKLELSSTDKIVLLALADWSNDDGVCWPSNAKLQKKSGLSERAVRQAIGRLEEARHLSRKENPGRGVIYSIHPKKPRTPARDAPGTRCPPAPDAPRHVVPDTPARGAPNTSRTTNTSQKASPSSRTRAKAPRFRLPDDWRPIRFADDTVAREIIDRRGRDWARAALESFRNWAANADDHVGRKTDWQKAWGNWVIREDKRDGNRNIQARPGAERGSTSASGFGRTVDAAQRFLSRGEHHGPDPGEPQGILC